MLGNSIQFLSILMYIDFLYISYLKTNAFALKKACSLKYPENVLLYLITFPQEAREQITQINSVNKERSKITNQLSSM